MERQVTPPRQVISPTWGPPPPCKQARRNIVKKFGNPQSLVAQLMIIHRVCLEVTMQDVSNIISFKMLACLASKSTLKE